MPIIPSLLPELKETFDGGASAAMVKDNWGSDLDISEIDGQLTASESSQMVTSTPNEPDGDY